MDARRQFVPAPQSQQARTAFVPPNTQAQAQSAKQATTSKRLAVVSTDQNEGLFRAAKKRKATDRSLPSFLPSKDSPATRESDLHLSELAKKYAALQKLERKLDWTISRKKADLAEQTGKTGLYARANDRNPSTVAAKQPCLKAILRLSVSHSVEPAADNEAPSNWTLKLSAHLIPPEKLATDTEDMLEKDKRLAATRRFGSMISKVVFTLEPVEGTLQESQAVTWSRSADEKALDGLTLSRPFTSTSQTTQVIKVAVSIDHTPERYKIEPVVGTKFNMVEDTRMGVLNALWTYIKLNKLMDNDGRSLVKMDDFLMSAVPFFALGEFMNRFMGQPEPVTVEYTIDADDKEPQTVYYDMPISIEDPNIESMQALLATITSTASSVPSLVQNLTEIDSNIAQTCVDIREVRARRDFLAAFAHDPKTFIEHWIQSQASDLDMIVGGPSESIGIASATADDMRRADFWTSLDALDDGVAMLNSRLFESRRLQHPLRAGR